MTTNSQLSTTDPKKNKKNLSKQLEQEQNHRNGDHMEGYQWKKVETKQDKWQVGNRREG